MLETKSLLPKKRETKSFSLEVKALQEDGTFEGILAAYGNVDLGGDLIERGAFAKTLQESGGEVPMLWQHDPAQPIGIMKLKDSPEGLIASGHLLLEVPQAKTAYLLLKAKVIKGLSIGFDTIQDSVDKGIRHLKELRLWEGSLVTFPMNLQALVSSVKARQALHTKDDFNEELQEIQLYSASYQMRSALSCALDSCRYDSALSDEQKLSAAADSIDQFKAAYLEMLPALLALETSEGMGWMAMAKRIETKAGAMLSAANRKIIADSMTSLEACKSSLQALLDSADAGKSAAAPPTTEPGPDSHSWFDAFAQEWKQQLNAQ